MKLEKKKRKGLHSEGANGKCHQIENGGSFCNREEAGNGNLIYSEVHICIT
jgi:hypothetical protein